MDLGFNYIKVKLKAKHVFVNNIEIHHYTVMKITVFVFRILCCSFLLSNSVKRKMTLFFVVVD